jgi:hypothetical protein
MGPRMPYLLNAGQPAETCIAPKSQRGQTQNLNQRK